MKLPLATAMICGALSGCSDPDSTQEKLVGDFEITGGREARTHYGDYTISKGGLKIADLDLGDESVRFTIYDSNGEIVGSLSAPFETTSNSGALATIVVAEPDGTKQAHQLIEARAYKGEIDPATQVLRGSVIHGGPLKQ